MSQSICQWLRPGLLFALLSSGGWGTGIGQEADCSIAVDAGLGLLQGGRSSQTLDQQLWKLIRMTDVISVIDNLMSQRLDCNSISWPATSHSINRASFTSFLATLNISLQAPVKLLPVTRNWNPISLVITETKWPASRQELSSSPDDALVNNLKRILYRQDNPSHGQKHFRTHTLHQPVESSQHSTAPTSSSSLHPGIQFR